MIPGRDGLVSGGDAERTLIEEVCVPEGRLRRLAANGDCAHERALDARYLALIEDRRARLVALKAAGRT